MRMTLIIAATLMAAAIGPASAFFGGGGHDRATCGGWLGPCPTYCDTHPNDPICD